MSRARVQDIRAALAAPDPTAALRTVVGLRQIAEAIVRAAERRRAHPAAEEVTELQCECGRTPAIDPGSRPCAGERGDPPSASCKCGNEWDWNEFDGRWEPVVKRRTA